VPDAERQKTRGKTGRDPEYDWVDLALRSSKLHRDFPQLTRNAIADKLREQLEYESEKCPDTSKLYPMLTKVFDFAKRSLRKRK
jgi:hypothetical protein